MESVESFLWWGLAAYIGGVLYVAYDKPDFYMKHMENWFFIGPLLLVFALFSWNFAVSLGLEQVKPLIPAEKLGEANALLRQAQVPELILLVLGGLSVLGILASVIAVKLLKYERSKQG
uniref:Uncharacterized protein n=1 Tax=Ectopseudomonas mendocina (strain ymp) TaxID=399739 RepID=A4XZH6_ECTM1